MTLRFNLLIFVCVCGLIFESFAQTSSSSQNITLTWDNYSLKDTLSGNQRTILYFHDATNLYETGGLPIFIQRIPLKQLSDSIFVKIFPLISGEDNSTDVVSSEFLNNEYQFFIKKLEINGKAYGQVGILPVRIHPIHNKIEVLEKFHLEITVKEQAFQNFPQLKMGTIQSVLSQGEWYKIQIAETGIYKISFETLQSQGINLSGIDPRNIHIHGNGGRVLPEANNMTRYDDLMEMSIYIFGEEDGKFDPGDYILFYAQGPGSWAFNTQTKRFQFDKHPYSDFAYCYITINNSKGKRIQLNPLPEVEATQTITTFTAYIHHEEDLINLGKSGRQWYGESFDIQNTMNFAISLEGVVNGSRVLLESAVVASSYSISNMKISVGETPFLVQTISPIPPPSLDSDYGKRSIDTASFKANSTTVSLSYKYIKPLNSSQAWLDYFTINYQRNLSFSGSQMSFRKPMHYSSTQVVRYKIGNASQNIQIWEVTNALRPMRMQTQLAGNTLTFDSKNDTLREFIAFDGSKFLNPTFIGKVPNQNLHGMIDADYIIISHPDFLSQAQELANIHESENQFNVKIVTPEMVYNEFSSGIQDPSAIRDFMRHLRLSSGNIRKPAYLLLFGDASYDYKDRIQGNTNFVPTYQSDESLNPSYSFATDDYFTFLDQSEGKGGGGTPDLCVGRIPVFTQQQADDYMKKFKQYISVSTTSMGEWRTNLCFVADDEDNNSHLRQADGLANFIDTTYPHFNIDKIFLDAYDQITTPGGQRYPDVNKDITQRIENGLLIINYTGHGGELGWAHERILEISDINSWNNFYKLPLFITATCEFSRYDDPQRVSAGEYVFLNPKGGGIALFTTSRLTYGGSNITLNQNFYKYAFERTNGQYRTLGEIIMIAKQKSGSDLNWIKFILLGDPALKLAYPENKVSALTINNTSIEISTDTLKALSNVSITGEVTDPLSYPLHKFNGTVTTTIFDKVSLIKTKANDPESKPTTFALRKNIIYKGLSEVKNGKFYMNFIVPKDIEYKIGEGKICFYACSDKDDAAGYFAPVYVGGINTNAQIDNTPPSIHLFMNDLNFKDGGITDENPVLLAFISDENGINTVGSGIGHDIVAILDNNSNNPLILNNYYKSDLNTYTSGSIAYPLFNLEEGDHEIRLTAWDVYNNSATSKLKFTVKNSASFIISNLYNYPNPFYDKTYFVFEHNKSSEEMQVEIRIMDIYGRVVKTIAHTIFFTGYCSQPIEWDGASDNGKRLSQGIYIYQLTLTDSKGNARQKSGKLMISKNQ